MICWASCSTLRERVLRKATSASQINQERAFLHTSVLHDAGESREGSSPWQGGEEFVCA